MKKTSKKDNILALKTIRKVHILDPGYNAVGHHSGFAHSLAKTFIARGYQPVFYVPKESDSATLEPHSCHCVFSTYSYVNLYTMIDSAHQKSSIALNRIIAKDLLNFPFQSVGPEDFIFANFFPNANSGFFHFFERLSLLSPKIQLAVYTVIPSGLLLTTKGFEVISDYAKVYQIAYSHASEVLQQRVLWGINSPHDAEAFSVLSELPFHNLPLPICGTCEDINMTIPDGQIIKIGSFGGARRDKGMSLWPELASCLLERHQDIEIVFHFSGSYKELGFEPVLTQLLKIAAKDPRLIVLEGFLDELDYYNYVQNLDLFLMTYDPLFWQIGYSGNFCNAMYFGVPVVVPVDSAMSNLIETHGKHGMGFTSQSVEDISDAITSCVKEINRFRLNRKNAASTFRSQHGTQNLVDYLLTYAPQAQVSTPPICVPIYNKPQIFNKSKGSLPVLDGSILDALFEKISDECILDIGAKDAFWAQEYHARGAKFVHAIIVEEDGSPETTESIFRNWTPAINCGLIDKSRLAITTVRLNDLASSSIGKFSHCILMDRLNSSMNPEALIRFAAMACTTNIILECAVSDGWPKNDLLQNTVAKMPRNLCDSTDTQLIAPIFLPSQGWLLETLTSLGFKDITIIHRHPLPTPIGSGRIIVKAVKC